MEELKEVNRVVEEVNERRRRGGGRGGEGRKDGVIKDWNLMSTREWF